MVIEQTLTSDYALYNGDCCEVMPTLPDESIDLSIYSPPFCADFTIIPQASATFQNCRSYEEFFHSL